MRLIIITSPQFLPHEADAIVALLRHGAWAVHLRKPDSTAEEMGRLIEAVPQEWHHRLVLHDHFGLAQRYGLKGVHLNRRNPVAPAGHRGSVSCSTHSIDELRERAAAVDYAFLSPIFDSISKQGYHAAFSEAELLHAQEQGIIGPQVMALGGVTLDLLPTVKNYGFGGAALLGEVWKKAGTEAFKEYLKALQQATEEL
ncbi:MAG: thiamine phosphate synthase [Prevotella sp.]|nr:thiamine phosphate synthase [Prevotella sp.]